MEPRPRAEGLYECNYYLVCFQESMSNSTRGLLTNSCDLGCEITPKPTWGWNRFRRQSSIRWMWSGLEYLVSIIFTFHVRLDQSIKLCNVYLFFCSLHFYPVKEAFGIVVNYTIRVKLYAGSLNTVVIAALPIVIMPCQSEAHFHFSTTFVFSSNFRFAFSDEMKPIEVWIEGGRWLLSWN